jgi:L-threonylcarbamoyladenylate synthase
MITTNTDKAKQVLENDGIIGFPTETVYGLAGNALSEKAIRSIFQLKNRPLDNPLIVHVSSLDKIDFITENIPNKAHQLADKFWPGPLTLLLKKSDKISDLVTAGQETVAVRIPNHPIALKLLESLDFPLVAPSANPYQSISPTSAKHVADYFENELTLVLDGGFCEKGLESTIVGFEDDDVVIYRLGSIPLEDIEACVGKVKMNTGHNLKSPGMAKKHYSPKTPLIVTKNIEEVLQRLDYRKRSIVCFDQLPNVQEMENTIFYSFHGDLDFAASRLYSLLHELDDQNLDILIFEEFPNIGLGKTINDRIKRASELK